MTKWFCDECSGDPCEMDDGDSAKSPHLCPIIRGKCANWRVDSSYLCGESTRKDKPLEERIENLEAWKDLSYGGDPRLWVDAINERITVLEKQMNEHYHTIDAMTGLVMK